MSQTLAELKHRLSEIKYSQELRRFIIRLHADVEDRLAPILQEKLYKGLAGRDLKRALYRDLYQMINAERLVAERLERLYVQDNERQPVLTYEGQLL